MTNVFVGSYLDGSSALVQPVTVVVARDSLAIASADGRRLALWPFSRLTARAAPTAAESRLGCRGHGLAELVVDNADFAALLLARAPTLGRAGGAFRVGWVSATCFAIIAVSLLVGLYIGVQAVAARAADLVPVAMERQWGDSYARGLIGGAETCEIPAGRRALDRLVARLTEAAKLPMPVTVHVVRSSMVNAFALPGGHVVLMSGLIDEADSADEVAGVLAHEIGHVAGRHGLRGLLQRVGAAGALSLVFGSAELVPDEALGELVSLSYTRDMEHEADRFALQALTDAGIRRGGVKHFFDRLAKADRAEPPTILSTHPASADRARLFGASKGGGPAMPVHDWQALRRICGNG